jgi:hypothetical protein
MTMAPMNRFVAMRIALAFRLGFRRAMAFKCLCYWPWFGCAL